VLGQIQLKTSGTIFNKVPNNFLYECVIKSDNDGHSDDESDEEGNISNGGRKWHFYGMFESDKKLDLPYYHQFITGKYDKGDKIIKNCQTIFRLKDLQLWY
jgi:hypothetical protein